MMGSELSDFIDQVIPAMPGNAPYCLNAHLFIGIKEHFFQNLHRVSLCRRGEQLRKSGMDLFGHLMHQRLGLIDDGRVLFFRENQGGFQACEKEIGGHGAIDRAVGQIVLVMG